MPVDQDAALVAVRRRRSRALAAVAGGLAALSGTLAFVGLATGAHLLRSYAPALPPMKVESMVESVLAGGALAWLSLAPPRRRWVGRALAGIAAAVAAASLLLLCGEALDLVAPAVWEWERPAVASMVAFLVVDAALLTMDRPTPWIATSAALAGASAAGLALLGFAFGASPLYAADGPAWQRPTALPTALAVLALGLGALAARPERAPAAVVLRGDLGGVAARRMLAGVGAVVPLVALAMIGVWTGAYGVDVGAALAVFGVVAGGAALLYGTATRLSEVSAAESLARAEVAESRASLARLFEEAADGILVADTDGRLVDANRAVCRMLRLSPERLRTMRVGDLVGPEDQERLATARELQLAGGTERGEWRLRRGDGSWVTAEARASILPDGRWLAFVRDASDVVAAREAEARLREQERRATARVEALVRASAHVSEILAELSDVGLDHVLRVIVEHTRGTTGAAIAAIALTEAPPGGSAFVQVGVPDVEAARLGVVLGRVVGPPSSTAPGATVRLADVADHPVLRDLPPGLPGLRDLIAVPVVFHGRPRGTLYAANKATGAFGAEDERVVEALAGRAAAAIATAEAFAAEALHRAWLERVLEQFPEAIVLIDPDGSISQLNGAARALAFDDAEGLRLHICQPDGTPLAPEENPGVRAALRDEEIGGVELAVCVPDDGRIPVLARATPVRTESGVRGAVAVLQDLRPFKEAERQREEWAALVAHDLRQPTTLVSVTADLLLRRSEALPAPAAEGLARIREASGRLRRMIDDLLDVSRLEARHLSLHLEETDVGTLVLDVVGGLAVQLADHPLRTEVAPGLFARVDPARIAQVLENLVSNAAKHGRPRGPVTVRAVPYDGGVRVCVVNEGGTLTSGELGRLFQRFSRLREGDASRPGVGLGLYIARGLIEAHGGRLEAEVEDGETRFHFTLPAGGPG